MLASMFASRDAGRGRKGQGMAGVVAATTTTVVIIILAVVGGECSDK